MDDAHTVTLRLAERRDSSHLLDWRNDPVTRANSRSTGPIARESHEAWLDRALVDPNRRIWIAESGDAKLGTVSAVREPSGGVEISITVAPERRGRGVGAAMLAAGVAETRRVWPAAEIRAVVRTGNEASRRLFEGCGFLRAGEDGGYLTYRWAG